MGNTNVDAAVTEFQRRVAEIRGNRIPWQSYLQGQMITEEEYNAVVNCDPNYTTAQQRATYLATNSQQCAKVLIHLIGHVAKDQTVQSILTIIDDLLVEDPARVKMFADAARGRKANESIWAPYFHLLLRPDPFIVHQAFRIVTKMACWGNDDLEGRDLQHFFQQLKDDILQRENPFAQTSARCLQMLLRLDYYRDAFVKFDGISMISTVLQNAPNYQLTYQIVFCLWCLTFNPIYADKITSSNVVPVLCGILIEAQKEKVIRIILGTFRNLLEKNEEDPTISQANALAMVHGKVVKQLENFESRSFDDEDLVDDIQYLTEKLQVIVQDMSSFDEYAAEVRSQRLEWSPVHKQEKFWRENAQRLNEKNYELLKILVQLLKNSKSPTVLCVAVHDIGEYIRWYNFGKHVIEQLGGKQAIMALLASHEDPNVKYEALLAVQKLMTQNWEYLGKQLEQDMKKDKKQEAKEASK